MVLGDSRSWEGVKCGHRPDQFGIMQEKGKVFIPVISFGVGPLAVSSCLLPSCLRNGRPLLGLPGQRLLGACKSFAGTRSASTASSAGVPPPPRGDPLTPQKGACLGTAAFPHASCSQAGHRCAVAHLRPVLGSKRVLVQQGVQAAVERGVLQAVLRDQDEDALQRQHAGQPACSTRAPRARLTGRACWKADPPGHEAAGALRARPSVGLLQIANDAFWHIWRPGDAPRCKPRISRVGPGARTRIMLSTSTRGKRPARAHLG